MLRISGYDVRAAYSGLSALAVAAEYEPTIVMMDIGLPELDGYEIGGCVSDRSSVRFG